MANNRPKPALLFTSHPLTGHLTPTLRIAAALAGRGFPVYFLGPTSHRARIASAGAMFLPLQRTADLDDLRYYSPDAPPTPDYWRLSWRRRGLVDFERTWIDVVPDEWASVVGALAEVRRREAGGRGVVLVVEAMFFGVMPLFLGAEVPGGARPRTVALSVTVPFVRSVDVPPFFVEGLGFGAGEEERRRNEAVWAQWEVVTEGLMERLRGKLAEAGAAGAEGLEGPFLSGQNYVCHDRILQMGVPGLFFPRSDWPKQFRFIGVLPPAEGPSAGWPNLPPWWAEVTKAAETGRKVAVVAQGTVEVDPSDLIIPTIRAMASRAHDVLVVAILGRKGAALPEHVELPLNARVTDYLHYDAVLPFASAWVHNGGYGALQHGIAHGVPMVVTGEGQDKIENARRIEWCGAGVNLGRVAPGVEEVRQAVGLVLDDKRFRQKVRALQKESQELACFDAAEREILALARE
ncbi:hypothetical protein B0H67DRAFT_477303 [Lasiosphaeris hirsuta]|uniref:Erythromycin biosynthesis protein CIII-like C-terminal domain-containing protein n=1 Tax=Lasiosphaeris hirsuta TaxID=260670 RepID=A0AA40BD27_9PEZI|nr:hypothetical protein B0H67DRAFT_477303 [Lasiosphaeris hirsuta]